MISLKERRRTNGCPVAAGSGGGPNSPGMVAGPGPIALRLRGAPHFVGSKRPSRFPVAKRIEVKPARIPFQPTRTSPSIRHRQTYPRKRQLPVIPSASEGSRPERVGHARQLGAVFVPPSRTVPHRLRGSG